MKVSSTVERGKSMMSWVSNGDWPDFFSWLGAVSSIFSTGNPRRSQMANPWGLVPSDRSYGRIGECPKSLPLKFDFCVWKRWISWDQVAEFMRNHENKEALKPEDSRPFFQTCLILVLFYNCFCSFVSLLHHIFTHITIFNQRMLFFVCFCSFTLW